MTLSIEQFCDIHNQLDIIAHKYAQLLHEYGGSVYSGPYISAQTQTFNFSVGPTTHGLSKMVTLPLSLLEDDSLLEELAQKQLAQWNNERVKNTCNHCGNVKYNYYDYYQ